MTHHHPDQLTAGWLVKNMVQMIYPRTAYLMENALIRCTRKGQPSTGFFGGRQVCHLKCLKKPF